MPILDKSDNKQLEKYNNFIRNFDGANLMQDVLWASVKKDWINEIVYLEENGNIVASMSILLQKLPKINSYLAYCPRGPVCRQNDMSMIKKLVLEAEELRKKYKYFVLKMDPEIIDSCDVKSLYIKEGYKVRGENSDVESLIQPVHNMILRLDGEDEETLFKCFSEKTYL